MIGCDCEVCCSIDPRNNRTRPSIAIQSAEHTILVDCAPEMRLQFIANKLTHADAVFLTHSHADHIFGLDDVRRFNDITGAEIPLFSSPNVLEDIRRIFQYIFVKTQTGGGKPRLSLHEMPELLELYGLEVQSVPVMHGKLPILAYRFNDMAYVTDVNHIPDPSMEKLRNLELLILDAVRYAPHSTHYGLYQALEVVEQLKPHRTLFTHLSHRMDHNTVNAILPSGVELAYDGMVIDL